LHFWQKMNFSVRVDLEIRNRRKSRFLKIEVRF
jgi:hypothetical protein